MKKFQLLLILQMALIDLVAQNWTLRWADEFNANGIDVLSTWNQEVNGDGGGNAELQFYRSENLMQESYQGFNCMVLNAKRENFQGKSFTSARVNTAGKVWFQYGKIESRIKIPATANGLWPAFWLLGYDFNGSNWPSCGEIDIMECGHSGGIASGTQSSFMGGALHWGTNFPTYKHNLDYTAAAGPYSIQDYFHLFTLIWTPESIKMYLDLDRYPNAAPFYQKIIAPGSPDNIANYFHKPYHLLYNLAVGGAGFTGIGNPNQVTALPTNSTPAKYYVDYIRVYQKGDPGEKFYSVVPLVADTEKPVLRSATLGKVTQNSAEFFLDGTDNSGSVIYSISSNGTTIKTEVVSGVSKTFVADGLVSGTTYNFEVTAIDAANNVSLLSVPLSVTTLAANNCAGVSNVASQGVFDKGYRYNFSTSGSNVTLTFELLDGKSDLVAYLWNQTTGFVEMSMQKTAPATFTAQLTGKTLGSSLKFSCKFAFAGGMSVTKQFVYQVGTNCEPTAINAEIEANIAIYPNPFSNRFGIKTGEHMAKVQLLSLTGKIVRTALVNDTFFDFATEGLASGVWILAVTMQNGSVWRRKVIKE